MATDRKNNDVFAGIAAQRVRRRDASLSSCAMTAALRLLQEAPVTGEGHPSIYHKDGYLFSCFEYIGEDYEGDMVKMAADPTTQKWWDVCKPCQKPLETRAGGEWWADMEEVFHTE